MLGVVSENNLWLALFTFYFFHEDLGHERCAGRRRDRGVISSVCGDGCAVTARSRRAAGGLQGETASAAAGCETRRWGCEPACSDGAVDLVEASWRAAAEGQHECGDVLRVLRGADTELGGLSKRTPIEMVCLYGLYCVCVSCFAAECRALNVSFGDGTVSAQCIQIWLTRGFVRCAIKGLIVSVGEMACFGVIGRA